MASTLRRADVDDDVGMIVEPCAGREAVRPGHRLLQRSDGGDGQTTAAPARSRWPMPRLGAGRGCDTLVSVTLGTCVGGGRWQTHTGAGAWPRGSAQVARNRRDYVPTLRISGPNALNAAPRAFGTTMISSIACATRQRFFASCYYLILSGLVRRPTGLGSRRESAPSASHLPE